MEGGHPTSNINDGASRKKKKMVKAVCGSGLGEGGATGGEGVFMAGKCQRSGKKEEQRAADDLRGGEERGGGRS